MSEPLEHPHGQEGEEEGEEEWESEDSWESDLDSEAEIAELMQMDDLVDDSASTGKQEYLAKCSELRIVPIAMFIAKLECEHINLRHHGMGVKGARAEGAGWGDPRLLGAVRELEAESAKELRFPAVTSRETCKV